jgi:hypothetical protein
MSWLISNTQKVTHVRITKSIYAYKYPTIQNSGKTKILPSKCQ